VLARDLPAFEMWRAKLSGTISEGFVEAGLRLQTRRANQPRMQFCKTTM